MQFYFLHDRNWFHFIWTFHWIQVHLGVMLIIILENLLMCFLCYGHFIPYMPTSESLLSHDALCMCVFVHMPGCVFLCIWISLSCQEVEPAQREAYWGKMCQQFLCNTSLLKGKFVSLRECVRCPNVCFSGPSGTFHTIENGVASILKW